jgi:hypothetical protein
MTATDLLSRLDGVRARGTGRYAARCPAHADKSPSLAITEGERGLLVKCWAGCTLDEITAALGIRVRDLFFNDPSPHRHRPGPKPVWIHRVALSFQFGLAALDRRLRAERVNQAIHNISINGLPDDALDRLVDAVGRAYADIDRAELLESVADGVRMKECSQRERMVRHAA